MPPKIEWVGLGMTKNYDQHGCRVLMASQKSLARLTSLSWHEIWRQWPSPVPDYSPVSPCFCGRRSGCWRSSIAPAMMSLRLASTRARPAPSPMIVRIASFLRRCLRSRWACSPWQTLPWARLRWYRSLLTSRGKPSWRFAPFSVLLRQRIVRLPWVRGRCACGSEGL